MSEAKDEAPIRDVRPGMGVYEVEAAEAALDSGQQQLPPRDARGVFVCAGCESPLFDAAARIGDGCVFSSALDRALALADVRVYGLERIAAACAQCGLHVAFVSYAAADAASSRFEASPVSLRFVPASPAPVVVGILPAWAPKIELVLDPPRPHPAAQPQLQPCPGSSSSTSTTSRGWHRSLVAVAGTLGGVSLAAAPVLLSVAEAAGWLAKLAPL